MKYTPLTLTPDSQDSSPRPLSIEWAAQTIEMAAVLESVGQSPA